MQGHQSKEHIDILQYGEIREISNLRWYATLQIIASQVPEIRDSKYFILSSKHSSRTYENYIEKENVEVFHLQSFELTTI